MTDISQFRIIIPILRELDLPAKYFTESFNAQVEMFPKMMSEKIEKVIDSYQNKALAWKLSGAGEGGYLILISEVQIPHYIRVKIRIKECWI